MTSVAATGCLLFLPVRGAGLPDRCNDLNPEPRQPLTLIFHPNPVLISNPGVDPNFQP